jgi:acyl-lipid omega-6 desaturase (Delta-12 desaturase)
MRKINNIKEISMSFKPNAKQAILSLLWAFFGLFLSLFLSYVFFSYSLVLFFLFLVLSSFFLVKLFPIQHDCWHYAFFETKKANDILWRLLSILTLTPYSYWKRHHDKHHVYLWNLDGRTEDGYVWGYYWTITVEEYKNLGFYKKLLYVLYHYPLLLVFILPVLNFLVAYRIPFWKYLTKDDQKSMFLNTIISFTFYFLLYISLWYTIFFTLIVPVLIIASILWSWMFMIQHNHKNAYWERTENYDFQKAVLEWSSFYLLPSWLHYLTWNIWYHHIHHLLPKIPSYYLPSCYNKYKCFHKKWLKVSESFEVPNLCLWDEKKKKLVWLSHFKYVSITLYIGFLLLSLLSWYLDFKQIIFVLLFLLLGVASFPIVFRKNAIKFTLILTLCGMNYLYFYFIWNNFTNLNILWYSIGWVLVALFVLFYFSKYIFSITYNILKKSSIIKIIFTFIKNIKNTL